MQNMYGLKKGKFYPIKDKSQLAWLELIKPTGKEIQKILSTYNLPKDYILDVNDPFELPRVEGLEDEKPNLFILNYPIQLSESSYIIRPISIICVDNIVITIRSENSPIFSVQKSKIHTRIKNQEDIETFVLELAWEISKKYIEYVKILNSKINSLEDHLKTTTKTDYLFRTIEIQKSLTLFQMSTRENGPVIESIFQLENLLGSNYRDDLLHDLQVENKQARAMIENSTILLDKLSNLYSNVINNNLNEVMKTLTSVTIVMTIPTIVGGLWGMNVGLPIEKNPHAFLYLILLCLFSSLLTLLFLKRKNYI